MAQATAIKNNTGSRLRRCSAQIDLRKARERESTLDEKPDEQWDG